MVESIEIEFKLPIRPEQFYNAWLDGWEHGRMTGSSAWIEPQVGGTFSSLNGAVEGKILELFPYSRIRQTWKMHSQPGVSVIELYLESNSGETTVHLFITGQIGGASRQIAQWWQEVYFRPIIRYFEEKVGKPLPDATR